MKIAAVRRLRRPPRIVRSRHHLLAVKRAAASGSRLRQPRTAVKLQAAVRAQNLPAVAKVGAIGIVLRRVPVDRADMARLATGAAAIHDRNST